MTKEERDALREKCMNGLECHVGGYAPCEECPYENVAGSCTRFLMIDALKLFREQPDDQLEQDLLTKGFHIVPEPNPLNVEIIGAHIHGKYVKIGITPDELEIQIPGVIAPHELPALVDEFNRVLAFARQNKMMEEETNEHD